jgi:serine/threonine protein phosphatase PrpC
LDPAVTTADRSCPSCGAAAGAGDRFCEACGADLPAAPGGARLTDPDPGAAPPPQVAPRSCPECGGAVDQDAYCTVCGAKAPAERDHLSEQPQPWLASVSDRGRRHHRNEDAAAVRAGEGAVAALVVCDGVSSAARSDVASLAAADAAAEVLASGSLGLASGTAVTAALGARMRSAAAAAAAAVAAESLTSEENPPSCTFVAAAVHGSAAVLGWVGDSRCYWLPDGAEPALLTRDDSVAAEQVAAGASREEAESGPQAHAITRWIGVDSPDQVPRVTTVDLDRAGWLLLCSDGLWNYASEPAAMRRLLEDTTAACGTDALAVAEAMVGWANEQGGHDNITVVTARFAGPETSSEGEAQSG